MSLRFRPVNTVLLEKTNKMVHGILFLFLSRCLLFLIRDVFQISISYFGDRCFFLSRLPTALRGGRGFSAPGDLLSSPQFLKVELSSPSPAHRHASLKACSPQECWRLFPLRGDLGRRLGPPGRQRLATGGCPPRAARSYLPPRSKPRGSAAAPGNTRQ